ncbi:MAG: hypothetical protein AAFQ73_02285 [Pseudomonadota bacterium]
MSTTEPDNGNPPPGYLSGAFRKFTDTTIETRSASREAWLILSALRAPLLTSLLGFVVFAFPGQTLEIYRLFIEDLDLANPLAASNIRFGCTFVVLGITGYSIWYMSRVLTLTDDRIRGDLLRSDVAARVGRWGPRILGALPAFGMSIGMTRATIDAAPDLQVGLAASAVVAFLIGVIRLYLAWRRTRRDKHMYENLRNSWLRWDYRVGLGLLILGLIGVLMTMPVQLAQQVGALTIMCFFLTALTFGASQLTFVNDRYAIPAITLLLLAAFTWSLFDINDNHVIRPLNPATVQTEPQALVAERALVDDNPLDGTFAAWLNSRADLKFYQDRNQPYPVYIVAAQGGGLYAAYQTSVFLARMQDACPNFAQHVFGVSGVSGGAVGGTLFTALAKRYGENGAIENPSDGCGAPPSEEAFSLEKKADAILRQDFLSPLVSALLFPDFFARFSPVPIPAFSREIALERTFEEAWWANDPDAQPGVPNTMEEGLLRYWSPEGAAPALFINTTEADTGRRMILSPLPQLGPGLRNYTQLAWPDNSGATPDMRLSTAMILSARFPWITPAGSVYLKHRPATNEALERRKARLVDGGYFENSGIETASDIVNALRLREERGEIDLHIIAFDLTEDRWRKPSYALGEILTPVKSLLSTRKARAPFAQERARLLYDAKCRYASLPGFERPPQASSDEFCPPSELAKSKIWSVSLNDYEYDFQLGWILSDETLSRINRQLGSVTACPLGDRFVSSRSKDEYLGKAAFDVRDQDDTIAIYNSCIAWLIARQLRGGANPATAEAEPRPSEG